MNKKLYIVILICFSLLSTFSCIDQIPFNVEENENLYLIVNAELRDNSDQHSIRVEINSEESNDFQANFPVDNAKVSIIENDQTKYEFEFNGFTKTYDNKGLYLKTGNNYYLEIEEGCGMAKFHDLCFFIISSGF